MEFRYSRLSKFGKKHYILLTIVILVSCFNVLYFYRVAYTQTDVPSLPIGWDTPNYVSSIKMVQNGDYDYVLERYDNVNFLYYFIASLIPSNALAIETYLPIFLAICWVLSIGFFVSNLTKNLLVISGIMLFTSAWMGLYRITSDLHAQLLATPIIFVILGLYLKQTGFTVSEPVEAEKETNGQRHMIIHRVSLKWLSVLIPILVIISSIIHFETALFLIIAFVISSIFIKRFRRFRPLLFQLVLPLIPISFLFVSHMLNPVYFPKDLRIINPPVPYETLLHYVGIFLPIILVGGVMCFRMVFSAASRSRYTEQEVFFALFTLVWSLLSLMIFRLDYFDNGLVSYSYRAAIFFPVPFLSASALFLFSEKRISRRLFSIPLGGIVITVFVIVGIYTAVSQEIKLSNSSYLSSQGYSSLISLSKTQFPSKPIFVYYPLAIGASAGGISEYFDNWVTAMYGDHFKYLGQISLLLKANETYFKDVSSRYYSYAYSRQIKEGGMWSPDEIAKRPIIVVQDFYRVQDLGADSSFRKVGDGIYQLVSRDIRIQQFALNSIASNNLGWYLTNKKFGGHDYPMFEAYVPGDQNTILSLTLPFEVNSCYKTALGFQDGSAGLGFRLVYGTKPLTLISYSGSGALREVNLRICTGDTLDRIHVIPYSAPNIPVENYFISLLNNIKTEKIEGNR